MTKEYEPLDLDTPLHMYIVLFFMMLAVVYKCHVRINSFFMLISGVRSLRIPRLYSNSFFGHIKTAKEPDGLLRLIERSLPLARQSSQKMSYFWLAFKDFLVIADPGIGVELFRDTHHQHPKTSLAKARKDIHKTLGPSISSTTGAAWQARRLVLERELSEERLNQCVHPMHYVALKLLSSAQHQTETHEVEIDSLVTRYATLALLNSFFNIYLTNVPDSVLALQKNLNDVMALKNTTTANLQKPLNRFIFGEKPTSEYLTTPAGLNWMLENALEEIGHGNIECSYEKELKAATDNASRYKIKGDLLQLFFDGIEPAATTLLYAIKLLADNPDVVKEYRKLDAEIFESLNASEPHEEKLYEQAATLQNVQSSLLKWIIQETLRLYPPKPYVLKAAEHDFYFNGYVVKKGTVIIYPTWLMQRLPDIWGPDADKFNPQRWSKPPEQAPHYYKPLGRGPKSCPAGRFAMQEMTLFLEALLANYDFSISKNEMSYTLERGGVAKPCEPTVMKMQPLSQQSSPKHRP